MAEFRSGIEEILKSGGGSRWSQYISWQDKEVKDIAFLTPADSIVKVRLHNFVNIPYTITNEKGEEEDKIRFGTFVCRKDPALRDESGNFCQLCDVIGHEATEKNVMLAVELEAEREGKKVVSLSVAQREFTDKDGNERSVPRWGLIIQAPKNFTKPLIAREQLTGEPITEVGWTIARQGADQKTSYAFVDIRCPLPDMSEVIEQVPDLVELLTEMGSSTKYEEELVDVKPGSQPKFGGGKQRPSNASSASTSDTRSEFVSLQEELRGVGAGKDSPKPY